MAADEEKDRIEFLEFAIQHLEARIRLVDNKATILIGIVGALGAAAAFLARAIFPEVYEVLKPDDKLLQQPYFAMSFVLCLCHLLDWLLCLVGLPAAACFCLLRTVRPTERSFQLKTHLKELYPQFYTLLWYSKHFSPSRRPDYERAVWEVPSTREAQSRATHFALLQLVQRKYKWYPWAALLLKIWVAVAAITVALLGLLLLLYGAWDLAKRC